MNYTLISQMKDNTEQRCDSLFFALLRFSLGIDGDFPYRPTASEWGQLFTQARRQSLVGVMFEGLSRLSEDYFVVPNSQETDSQTYIPQQLAMQWANDAEVIAGLNSLQNIKAARMTELFEKHGHHTVILKGQANALLYPNPLSRQPGDIDIYVDGGFDSISATLEALGMSEGAVATTSFHFKLPPDEDGIEVEVHFKHSSKKGNPVTNERLQACLTQLLDDGAPLSDAGFRVPSIAFALTMQLAHISRHVIVSGIGLRQVTDYYLLLQSSTEDDRRQLAARLKELGLLELAGALMWVLGEVFRLPSEKMIITPDQKRGQWLLRCIVEGGNFGKHDKARRTGSRWQRGLKYVLRRLRLVWFYPGDARYIMRSIIPPRIRKKLLFFTANNTEK